MKKILSVFISLLLIVTLFAACGKNKAGRVYYLNFKPEQDAAWQALAKKYTADTGVEVKVVTAAAGTYEQTLTAEIDKNDAPTLFQISGVTALESWGDYCSDLTGTEVYKQLKSDEFALKKGSNVYGVGYVYEGYGIIVNKKLLKKAGYEMDDIENYEELKAVAEDITKRKNELGFAAFTSPGLDTSSSWRFSGHLANIPLYYEFKEGNITAQPEKIVGTYVSAFKNIWDLYIKNSVADPATLTAVTNDQATAEFTNEKAVFHQNGTWAYSDVKSIGDDNLGFIPLYSGIDDEKQGFAAGTENYWAVNKNATEADRMATLDFLEWVVTSDVGTTALAENMGFAAPFKKAKPVNNKLSNILDESIDDDKYNVAWVFGLTPNVDAWRSDLVSALASYSAGKAKWEDVEKAFVEGWEKHYKTSKQ